MGTGWLWSVCVQPIDNRPEPLDQLQITISEFVKCMGLRLEYSENLIRRSISIDGGSQWVVTEILSSAFGILVQGCVDVRLWGGRI